MIHYSGSPLDNVFSITLSVEEIMDIKLTLTLMSMKLNKSTNAISTIAV